MQHEVIEFPPDVDYHAYNDDDTWVLRTRGDQGRYACHYYSFEIGEPGGEYGTLQSGARITLTRQQVADLARHLVGLLAARPS